jgi:predicted AAA+ superfamily ATPase
MPFNAIFVRVVFPDYTYLNLENLDVMAAATEDPRRFLEAHREKGAIIDEAQRAPELFSYLQGIVDESGLMGRYVLTGSQNFLLLEKITHLREPRRE